MIETIQINVDGDKVEVKFKQLQHDEVYTIFLGGKRSMESIKIDASISTINKAIARAVEWEFGVVAWERR